MTEGQHDHRAGRRVLLGGALALGLASPAFAQARPRRLGVLAPGRFSIEGVRQWTLPVLARLGFAEGRNLDVLLRHTDGDPAPLPALAAELAAARCDVAIAVANPVARLLRAADPRLPIVMGFAGNDPVADGLAESLARPGGLATGIVMLAEELDTKRLEPVAHAPCMLASLHVTDGVYARAGARSNQAEARAVVTEALKVLRGILAGGADRSLGIITRVRLRRRIAAGGRGSGRNGCVLQKMDTTDRVWLVKAKDTDRCPRCIG